MEPISRNGLYNLPIKRYHSGKACDGPSFSKSGLSAIVAECPAMYWAFSPHNPKRLEKPETQGQLEGRLIGAYVIGDAALNDEFIIAPYDDFRSKDARAWRDSQDKTVINAGDLDKAKAMKVALLAQPDVAYVFEREHYIEQTIAFKETHTGCGLWCLSRPDMMTMRADQMPCDYKRFHNIHPERLQYLWHDFGSDMQAAMALDGLKAVTGETRPGFTNLVQMPEPPYFAQMMVLSPEQVQYGRKRYLEALEIAARCLESGRWPKWNNDQPAYYLTPKRILDELEEGNDGSSQQPAGDGSGEEDASRYLAAG